MIKKKYRVNLNWYGEVHTFFTSSSTEKKALTNAISQLAKKNGYNRAFVKRFFLGDKDNFSIKERR